jgi:RNA polymerase sigma-70 factor, ECF subfamily
MGEPHRSATAHLLAWGQGDGEALNRLAPLVDAQLRKIARRQMSKERGGHTLQATALVNEAYLRLVDGERVQWQSRAHFFAVAARIMRHILVDHARARGNLKRGRDQIKVSIDAALDVPVAPDEDLVALDEALRRFAEAHPRPAQVVELRFFGGLSLKESAEVVAVSVDTIKRDWRFAKMWLLRELNGRSRGGRRVEP